MPSFRPDIGLDSNPGLKAQILASRLGKCWKCMTISTGLAITSFALLFVFSGFDESTPFTISLVAAIVFGALTLTHFVTFVLRKTAWRELA